MLNLTYQARPELVGQPLAVLDDGERLLALSAAAATAGVTLPMTPARAQLACPQIEFQEANLPAFAQTQQALLETLTEWELPTEEAGWGLAYVDLHRVSRQRVDVQSLAGELGGRLRRVLGDELAPCLGWDSGKFTARAAALRTQPGRMKLIDAAQEAFFLQPLPITLLPLPAKELRWLERLGIRTLGQFGALPTAQVQTALGKAGVAAQQWAQGHDDRPVVHTVTQRFSTIGITFGQPMHQLNPVVTALMETLRPHLAALAAACRGVQRLDLALHFGGEERHLALTFVEPTAQEKRIGNHLTHQLQTLIWPERLTRVTITNLQTAELAPPAQLQLFEEAPVSVDSAAEWLAGLRQRYGAVLYRGALTDPTHPLAHCRAMLQPAP
ncbi:MAG: hypothetical protein R3A44_44020 [Caldilineaceae bacterium]